jgi:ferredoxin
MWHAILRAILWSYWWLNRPFLRALAEAFVGHAEGNLRPDGAEIIARLETLLGLMTFAVWSQTVASLLVLPLWTPRQQPRQALLRFLLALWTPVMGHLLRPVFVLRPASRDPMLTETVARLNAQAAADEDDLLKPIVIIQLVKALLTSTYLDLDRTWTGIAYRPFTERSWSPPSGPDLAHPPPTPNAVLLEQRATTPGEVARKPAGVTTYLVIGSGAGGATVANAIKQQDEAARVIVLDTGPLVSNNKLPQHLMTTAASLYMNGGVTLSANEKYTFVQARCVGGGTVLNNSVALKPLNAWWKQGIVEHWTWLGAALDWDRLDQSYDAVMRQLNVHPVEQRAFPPLSDILADGFRRAGFTPTLVTCNLRDCVGCGRCNAGCQYGAKQAMTETTLPNLVKAGGLLVPNTHATRLILDGPPDRLVCRGAQVRGPGGEFTIEADKVILAAGAFASTKILRRSGFTGANAGVRTVGKRFSGNMGTPVFGIFDQPVDGWRGIQVSYAIEMPENRLVIELGYGPPPALGLQASQWGAGFMSKVQAYDRMGVAIPVMGTSAYGDIVSDLSPSGYSIDFEMIDDDWYRLALGIRHCAEALFAAGAREVFTTRSDGATITRPEQIAGYVAGTGPLQYLKVTTAHLQGGNVINADPNLGVVDTDFHVHGIDRLWITDASVMPAPITLNVQLTIMALAHYAAAGIVHA